MRSIRNYLLASAAVFAIAAGPARAQEPDPATEAPQPTATAPAATPTPSPMAPTAMPNDSAAVAPAPESPAETPVTEAAPVEAAPAPVQAPVVETQPQAAPPPVVPAPAVAPERPVRKPAAKPAPKKPLEPAAVPEKSDREKALDSAAAGAATDTGAVPPSDGGVSGTTAPSAPSAEAVPMVPPVSAPSETAAARSESTDEAPAESGRGAGTWIVFAVLALGVAYVVRLTVRRRQVEDLSIFDRGAPRPVQPPIVHHS
jgi:fused signal recognition particle receptor